MAYKGRGKRIKRISQNKRAYKFFSAEIGHIILEKILAGAEIEEIANEIGVDKTSIYTSLFEKLPTALRTLAITRRDYIKDKNI